MRDLWSACLVLVIASVARAEDPSVLVRKPAPAEGPAAKVRFSEKVVLPYSQVGKDFPTHKEAVALNVLSIQPDEVIFIEGRAYLAQELTDMGWREALKFLEKNDYCRVYYPWSSYGKKRKDVEIPDFLIEHESNRLTSLKVSSDKGCDIYQHRAYRTDLKPGLLAQCFVRIQDSSNESCASTVGAWPHDYDLRKGLGANRTTITKLGSEGSKPSDTASKALDNEGAVVTPPVEEASALEASGN